MPRVKESGRNVLLCHLLSLYVTFDSLYMLYIWGEARAKGLIPKYDILPHLCIKISDFFLLKRLFV